MGQVAAHPDAINDSELLCPGAYGGQGIALPINFERDVIARGRELGDRLDNEIDAVMWRDRSVIDDAEAAGLPVRASGVPFRKELVVERVHDDSCLRGRDSVAGKLATIRLVDGDDGVGEARCPTLHEL